MSVRSIGELNVKISGSAQQLIQEMNRASAGVAGTVTKIDREIGRLQRGLERKFTVSDIGKDIVKGLGIGSGFALAQEAADLLVKHWSDAAAQAKAVEESTARQLAIVEKIIAARQTPVQQAATAWKDERASMRNFTDTQAKAGASWSNALSGTLGGNFLGPVLDKFFGTPTQADVQSALTEWQNAYGRFLSSRQRADAEENKIADQNIQRSFQQIDRLNKELGEIDSNIATAAQQRLQAYWDEDAALQKKADALLDTLDPMREYRRELELINQLEMQAKLTNEQASWLRESRQSVAVEKKLKDFFAPLDEQSAANFENLQDKQAKKAEKIAEMGERIGYAFTRGFEDAIFEGEKLSDVLDQLGQDIMRIALRTMITEPLGQMLGFMVAGGIGKIFGGFFADGGRPPLGIPSIVGERGPELFVPDSAGTIIPNHVLSGSGGSLRSGGNVTYAPVYNIAAGVTRQDLLPILKQHGRGIMAAITDAQRRGAPLSAAFA